MIKFVVSSEKEKEELLEASRRIHDSDIDTDHPMVNTLAHLYLAQAAWLIEVDPSIEGVKREEPNKNSRKVPVRAD